MRERATSNQRVTRAAAALAGFASALAVLHLLGALSIAPTWTDIEHHRLTTKALVETINFVDEPELLGRYVHAIVPPLRERANLLDRIGFLSPGLIKSNSIAEIVDPSQTEGFGQIQQAGKTPDQQFAMLGWAVLPMKGRPADAVLLTFDNSKGQSIIFALSEVGVPRADVAQTLGDNSYLHSGWAKAFNPDKIPHDVHSLRAWAFDAETARAYPLQGAMSWPP
jgi:hypothetical protein